MGIIRLLLALSVVLSHSYSFFRINILGGELAVQAFFIISGFYMSLILNEKYIAKNGSYNLFISNRFMRIFPIYLCVLLLSALFYQYGYMNPPANPEVQIAFGNPMEMYAQYYPDITLASFFFLVFTNMLIFFQDCVMFMGLTPEGSLFFTPNFWLTNPQLYKFLLIPQAWSIALELTFYLIAPFLVRRKVSIIITLILSAFALRFIAYQAGYEKDPWSYRFLPFELAYFLLGTLSYNLYKKIRTSNIKREYLKYTFGFIIGLTIVYPVIKFPGSSYLYCTLFAISLPFVFHLTKNWKYDTYMGDLSYPIYLVHIILLYVVYYFSAYINHALIGILYLILIFGSSIVLNEVISRPIEKIRQRRITGKNKNEQAGFNIQMVK